MFGKKDFKLGIATEKRRYDLPLNKGEGTNFLITLIALMTFLAVLAIAASFALGAMVDRWSSGLESKVTIEVPAESSDGIFKSPEQVGRQAEKISERLGKLPAVAKAHALDDKEIQDLISPWLGDDAVLKDIPMPGLVAVDLKEPPTDDTLAYLDREIKAVAPDARLDRHEDWLNTLLRFTGSLQFAAGMITLIIGATTITAIAGAIRSRMAIHHKEVELLHLMGADDAYITRQFLRHSLIIALQGGMAGTGAGLLTILLLALIAGDQGGIMPGATLSLWHFAILLLMPAIICGIAAATARHTVLRVLSAIP